MKDNGSESSGKKGPVPYKMTSPGFEAIYTGKKRKANGEKTEMISTVLVDQEGNEIRKWPVFPWTFPGQEGDWDEEVKLLNKMQNDVGPLDDNTRQLRAHIASLIPCDSGLPVTIDELLNGIGRGRLEEPTFHNGCWCSGMWWEQKTTQPKQMESIRVISNVLQGYLAGEPRDRFIEEHPEATNFINRTYDWLGPVSKMKAYQTLMIERILFTLDFFTDNSNTKATFQFSDSEQMEQMEVTVKDLFDEGGQGAQIDEEISMTAGLPPIYPRWHPEYAKTLSGLMNSQKSDLYETCCAIASGVHTLSDCHHNTFRYIESWIHGTGRGSLRIPTRKAGAERLRLGHLLFGYVLGLDKWLLNIPMQFLLLDVGHADLGFNPKNEILRVYAYLGEERTPVKEWLAASLWHNLYHNPVAGNPGGLIRHKYLLKRAEKAGLNPRGWMDRAVETLGDQAGVPGE